MDPAGPGWTSVIRAGRTMRFSFPSGIWDLPSGICPLESAIWNPESAL